MLHTKVRNVTLNFKGTHLGKLWISFLYYFFGVERKFVKTHLVKVAKTQKKKTATT
jgi:hypothetical protein